LGSSRMGFLLEETRQQDTRQKNGGQARDKEATSPKNEYSKIGLRLINLLQSEV